MTIHLSTRSPLYCPDGEAWLYGCGPSLDEIVWYRDGECRLAINEAVLVVDPSVGIAWDLAPVERIGRYCAEHREPEPEMLVEWDVWKNEGSNWIRDFSDCGRYFHRRDCIGIHGENGRPPGTANVAIVLLAQAGAKRVHLRGFDTFWDPDAPADLAPSIVRILEALDGPGAAERRYHRRQPGQYQQIANAMRQTADHLGVELVP